MSFEKEKAALPQRSKTDAENQRARQQLDTIKQKSGFQAELGKKLTGNDQLNKQSVLSKGLQKLDTFVKTIKDSYQSALNNKNPAEHSGYLKDKLLELKLVKDELLLKKEVEKTKNNTDLFNHLILAKTLENLQEMKRELLNEKEEPKPKKQESKEHTFPIEQGEKSAVKDTEEKLGGFLNNLMKGAEQAPHLKIHRYDIEKGRVILNADKNTDKLNPNKEQPLTPNQYLQKSLNQANSTPQLKPTPGSTQKKDDEQQQARSPFPNPRETPTLKIKGG